MFTDTSEVQPSNALEGIFSMVLGMFIVLRVVQPLNAFAESSVTGVPL